MSNLEDLLQARLAELKEQTSRAAEILVKHHSAHVDLAPDQMFRFTCTCEHSELVGGPTRRAGSKTDWLAAHQADQLANVFADSTAHVIRDAGAAALLAAAGDVFDTAIPAEIARWLEARAKAITNPIRSPECETQQHQACDGRAFDLDIDEAVQCLCSCHP